MGTPTLYDLAEAAAEALSGTTDADTGIKHQVELADDDDTPSAFAQLMNLEDKLMRVLAAGNRGQVVWSGSGLTVGAYPLEYELAGSTYSFAGNETFSLSLTASDTNYVYLDTNQILKAQITAWPSGDHFKLAKVVCNATQVTEIVDMRLANLMIGIINAWWTVVPTADVDMNAKGHENIGSHAYKTWTELTISSGSITPTQVLHSVDTEADAATDDLTDITAVAGAKKRRLLILSAENAARVVTVKSTGNVTLLDGDYVMDSVDKLLVLLQDSDTTWTELFRNYHSVSVLNSALDANNQAITDVGKLGIESGGILNIASGAITVTGSWHMVDTESGDPTDDLDTISGATHTGQLLILRMKTAGHVPTIKHGTGNIYLANDKDYVLSSVDHRIVLEWYITYWVEVARSHLSIADLVDTAEAIPYTFDVHISGTPSVAVGKWKRLVPKGFTLKDVHGYAKTAPSGGAAIFDVLKNGSSIFTSQAEMVNIADGANSDTSATKNAVFADDDYIEWECEAANGAADITLTFNGYIAPKTPPT
jgi:hypothetical protein